MKRSQRTTINLLEGLSLLLLLQGAGALPARADTDPMISTQPESQSVTAGSIASLNVAATGTEPLGYAWYFNGSRINGATNATLAFTNVQLFDAGDYRVIVTNLVGAATSSAAALNVSFSPDFLWAQQAGGTNNFDGANGVATDLAGNVYVAGQFRGPATFGTNTLVTPGNPGFGDMFLAKYDTNGELVWVRQAGNVYEDGASALGVDGAGNVYVTGWYMTNITFGTTVLTNYSTSGYDIFLAKYDASGNALWAVKGGGNGDDYPAALALDQNGNPVMTGYFNGTGHFGNLTFSGYGNDELFVAKYDANGNFIWAGFASGSQSDRGEAVAADAAGNTYIGGQFYGIYSNGTWSGNLWFSSGTTLNSLSNWVWTPFFAKYDPAGNLVWARVMTNIAVIEGMAGAATNGFYVTGDNFSLLRVDAAGIPLWSTSASSDEARSSTVTLDQLGNLYLAGTFYGTNLTFPTLALTNGATTNIGVIAWYDPNGTFYGARQFGGPGGAAKDIAVDSTGRLYAAGTFKGSVGFGTNTLTSAGAYDIFVGRIGVLPPVILVPPVSQTAFTGTSNTFNVSANGEPLLAYQWRFSETNIPGATNRFLLVANLQLADAGLYSIVVSNDSGVAVSPPAMLTVITGAPAILRQPQPATVLAGSNAFFSVVATNSLPFFYQWRFNGTNIAGANAASLAVSNATAADRGDYSVEITNSYGGITSDSATLTVNVPPTIAVQPTNQVAPAGSNVTFAVEAAGDPVFTYQWRFNGSPVSSATNSGLTLLNVQLADEGSYSVVVSNQFGKATSAAATLVVNAPPTITAQPQDLTLPAGTNATFIVVASGSPTLRYQWRFYDLNLAGRTQASLILTNVQSGNAGPYTVVVTNDFGAVISSPAMLAVDPSAPVILVQPANLATNAGSPAGVAFSVLAIGSDPLAYQWQYNGVKITGATNASLALAGFEFTNAGNYRVVVTNALGAVTSATAVLTIDAGFLWARRGGGAANDSALAAVADTNGNTYVAGYFSGTADFSGTNLVSNGGEDILVAKYNRAGNLLWIQPFGGSGNDRATALALSPEGRLAVAGSFEGSVQFGGTNLSSAGGADAFLARLDTNGNVIWAVAGGGPYTDVAQGVAIDYSGRFLVTGYFQTNANFGGTAFSDSTASNKVFVARYDGSTGDLLWARKSDNTGPSRGRAVTSDSLGNPTVAGSFGGTAAFGGFTIASSGGLDGFVARYDSNGGVNWLRRLGTVTSTPAADDEARGISCDSAGNIFVTGYFQNQATFSGSNSLFSVTTNQPDFFLARLDANGNVQWVKQAGGADADSGNSVAVDALGNAYVTGTFSNAIAFAAGYGQVILTGAGRTDVFAALYDSAGTLVSAQRGGGAGNDAGQAMATDSRGSGFVAGQYSGTAGFGPTTLTNAGGSDLFLSRLSFFASNAPPVITTPPHSQSVGFSNRVSLNAGVVSGAPVTWCWRLNGANISGATSNGFTRANVQYPDLGEYTVVVSNAFGRATSAGAVVTFELSPEFLWLRKSGGPGDDQALALALDGTNGAIYLAGLFSGTNAALNNLVSSGSTDVFLARYDTGGNLVWARRAGGTTGDVAQGLAVDTAGNVFVTGGFLSTQAVFGSFTLTNQAAAGTSPDLFLAKYDRDGNVLWARSAGSTKGDQGTAVALDGAGNVYLTGSYFSLANLGGILLSNLNSTNFFIAKFDPAGNVLWARTVTGTNTSQGSGVAVDAATNVYVTGYLLGSANFGSGVITNNSGFFNATVFVAKYDREGALQWARKASAGGVGYGQAIVADPAGGCYATSYKRDYGAGVMLTRYDSAGNSIWYRTAAISCCTGDYTAANGLALDPYGNPVVTGFGNGSIEGITNYFGTSGYVLKYRSDGSGFWMQRCGTAGWSVAVDAAGNAFVAGRFTGTSYFGATSNLVSSGGNDAFLVKLGVRPPGLSLSRTNLLVVAGAGAVLQIAGASGTGPFAYQWQFNGTNIAGATNPDFALSNFRFNNAGRYSVVLYNTSGSVTGQVAAVGFVPVVGISSLSNSAVLSWDGLFTLQSAMDVPGPYVDWPLASCPFTNPFAPGESQRFFRLRVGNPTLMGTVLTNHRYAISVLGSPGRLYTIQASTNLVDWADRQTDASPFTFEDTNAIAFPGQFYRALLGP
jgi:hypothetical protein